MSEFFLLWTTTRLRENGWPAKKGLIRRKLVVDESALAGALAEAVQIAIPIGALPTKAEVDSFIDESSYRGDEKIQALPNVYPLWRRFVSITVQRSGERQVFPWSPAPGESVLDWDSAEARETLAQVMAAAGIAMGWAIRHPDQARGMFTLSEADIEEASTLLGITRDEYLASALSPFEFSLSLARTLVEKYEGAGGARTRYSDLT